MAYSKALQEESREMYATGLFSRRDISGQLGVSHKTIRLWTGDVAKGSNRSNLTKHSRAELLVRLRGQNMGDDGHLKSLIDGMKADKAITFQGKVFSHEPDWPSRIKAATEIAHILEDDAGGLAKNKKAGPSLQVNITVESLIKELDRPNQAIKAEYQVQQADGT